MKSSVLSFIIIALMLAGCSKPRLENNVPDCIESNIAANKTKPGWNVKRVDEYEYQGNLVYIFEPEHVYPDMQAAVIKSDCTTICTLGGIAGITMCNGDRFSEKAKLTRTIWQK